MITISTRHYENIIQFQYLPVLLTKPFDSADAKAPSSFPNLQGYSQTITKVSIRYVQI